MAFGVLPPDGFEENHRLPPKQQALHDLWETIWYHVNRLTIDPSPRLYDKLCLIHEMTNPAHRRDPMGAAAQLEVIAQMGPAGRILGERYLTPIGSALLKYAVETKKAKVEKGEPAKVEATMTSDERDHGF